VLKDTDGSVLDATDIVKMYVESLPGQMVNAGTLQLNRIHLVNPLPKAEHGLREVQPIGSVSN
jgi:hypothetical protein